MTRLSPRPWLAVAAVALTLAANSTAQALVPDIPSDWPPAPSRLAISDGGISRAFAVDRLVWRHNDGHFENTAGNRWVEESPDGTFYFREVYRGPGYIELYDFKHPKPSLTPVRLSLHWMVWNGMSTGGRTRLIVWRDGTWKDASS
jgi:hypothetical protein